MTVIRGAEIDVLYSAGQTQALIADIYDCAASPDLWPTMLSRLRDQMSAAYCLIGFADVSRNTGGGIPNDVTSRPLQIHSPWDEVYIRKAAEFFGDIPGVQNYLLTEADQTWTQMEYMPEAEFRETKFFSNFCKPQGLRDCLNLNVIKRPGILGGMVVASYADRALFSAEDKSLIEVLSPHFRRALLINDVADKGKLALTLFQRMLDQLLSPVILVGDAHKIEFANSSAQSLFSAGDMLMSSGGKLGAARATGLMEAVARACKGEEAAGISGIGIPLLGEDGARAAAYVLPMGRSEVRNELGKGYCAVFVAQRNEQLPVITEVLRTMFDLTPMEAKVAALIAEGDKPAGVASALGLSIHTVRTHVSNALQKTEMPDQARLTGLVNSLSPPVQT